jgi:hypothetical protein
MSLSLVATLITLGLVEVYLRLYAPQALYAIRYCYLGWCHVPGASFVRGGETREFVTRVRYNSQGLRDHEYPVTKPPGTRRVLLFGDSFAEALEVELDGVHAKRLERLLRARGAGRPIEVINFGVSAYDTAQEWWYFRTEGIRYSPDVVIVLWNGEAGSPFVRMDAGRPVFVEPRYGTLETRLRELKTFVKVNLHVASFVFGRLGVTRTAREVQDAVTRRPRPASDYRIPPEGRPALPFPPEWKTELAIFEDWERAARDVGARLVVATIVRHDCRWLAESLRLRPIPGLVLVDLQQVSDQEELAYRFARDSHYNARGHDKAARVLFETITSRDLLAVEADRAMAGGRLEAPAC